MRAWAGVVLAGLVLSGCGTAVAATGGGARWTATGGGQQAERTPRGGPTAGSRAEAAGLAKRLLARLPLPPGTVSAGKRSVPEGMRDLPGAPGGDWAIQTRLLVAPGQPDVVSAYLQRHHPRGASVTTGSSDMFGERTLDVNFEVRAPAGIQLAELGFQIQKLTSTTSLVYADAFVV